MVHDEKIENKIENIDTKAFEFRHPWENILELPTKDPVLTDQAQKDLYDVVMGVLNNPTDENAYTNVMNCVIAGGDPLTVLGRIPEQLKSDNCYVTEYLKHTMNLGLLKGRVKPFGSCGKANCFLGEYVFGLTAPRDSQLYVTKQVIATMLPELLSCCHDPRRHVMDGKPITVVLSDILFQEKDHELVAVYKTVKQDLYKRFKGSFFLSALYQVAYFDAQQQGCDEKTFCQQEGFDQNLLWLREDSDSKIVVQRPVLVEPNTKLDIKRDIKLKRDIKRDRNVEEEYFENPWKNFKKLKLATRDIPVSSEHNEKLKGLIQEIARDVQAVCNGGTRSPGIRKNYIKIRNIIASGGDPDYTLRLALEHIGPCGKKLKLLREFAIARSAAHRSVEGAINLGLMQGRRQPFGNCGMQECVLSYYVLVLLSPNGQKNTPLSREDAWCVISKILTQCPCPKKHIINGKNVVKRLDELLQKPVGRLINIRETVLNPLKIQVNKLLRKK